MATQRWQEKHDDIQSPGDAESDIAENFGPGAVWTRSNVKNTAILAITPT